MTPHTRRDFLRLTCCSAATAAIVGGLSKFGLVSAMAQGAGTDYKALGMHIFVWRKRLQQFDRAHRHYRLYELSDRSRQSGAQPERRYCRCRSATRPISDFIPIFRSYRHLFNNNKSLAVLTNVGTLVQPTTRANYQIIRIAGEFVFPCRSAGSVADHAIIRLAECRLGGESRGQSIDPAFNTSALFPPILSVAGNPIFCTGELTRPFTMNPGSTPGVQNISSTSGGQARFQAMQQLLTFDSGFPWCRRPAPLPDRRFRKVRFCSQALQNIPAIQTVFPRTMGWRRS